MGVGGAQHPEHSEYRLKEPIHMELPHPYCRKGGLRYMIYDRGQRAFVKLAATLAGRYYHILCNARVEPALGVARFIDSRTPQLSSLGAHLQLLSNSRGIHVCVPGRLNNCGRRQLCRMLCVGVVLLRRDIHVQLLAYGGYTS